MGVYIFYPSLCVGSSGFKYFVPSKYLIRNFIRGGGRMSDHLGVFDQKNRQELNRAPKLVNGLIRLRIFAVKMGPEPAFFLDTVSAH
jgi:hypothetical protein